MSRKSQSSSARSSRFGVRGLGFPKSPTSAQAEADEWYIPYNGPYEVPKDYLLKEHDKRRDTVYKVEDTVFGHKRELQYRSGIEGRKKQDRGGWSSEPEDRKVRNKLRAPPNSARAAQRRSTHASSNIIRYTPASTFSTGSGIGESPMPIQRQLLLNPSVAPSNRLSLGNFLSFGAKKTTVQWPPPTREFDDTGELFSPKFNQPTRRKRTSQDEARPLLKAVSIEHLSTRHSALTDDEDYYSTLASHPKRDHNSRPQYFGDYAPRSASKTQPQRSPAHPILEDDSEQSPPPTVTVTSPNPRPHPYAYVFPSAALSIDTPRSAPPAPHAILPPQKLKVLCSSSEDNHASTSRTTAIPEHLKPPYSRGPLLKGSISTPNLRGSVKDQGQHSMPRGKERWLSAETWCDALLFPRPRFKIKHGSGSGGSDDEKRSSGTTSGKGSGRIVSPPETPILRMDFDTSADLYSWTVKKDALPTPVVPPRPNRPRGLTLPTMTRPPTPPITRDLGVDVHEIRVPKRSAKDDLELPSPAPSLNRVLEEGDDLERQRNAWRQQAQQSFQNKRTRSLSRSRSRSKSLSHSSSHRRRKDAENAKPMGSIDFLAARSLLGTQSMAPTITSPRPIDAPHPTHTHTTSGAGTTSANSQSHGTHSHTNSKSSNRGHSRNPSWQKSALRVAKSAGALCGLVNEDGTPIEQTAVNLEHALSGSNEMRRVRMAEPTEETWGEKENLTSSIGHGGPEAGVVAISPTPSGATGEVEGVGIAVTSEDSNMNELRMPDHPYGAGVYGPTHTTQDASGHRRLRSADYAGPHPTTSRIAPVITVSDVSTRHRHPYAQQSSPPSMNEAGIQPQIRDDSVVSPASKMWAQLYPGEIQEILPEEIVYSPDLRSPANATPADDGHSAGDSTLPTDDESRPTHAYVLPDPNRNTRLGVVEALTSAFHGGRSVDSGDEEFMASRTTDGDRPDRTEAIRDKGNATFGSASGSENSSDSLSRAQPIRRKPGHLQGALSHPATTQSPTPADESSFVLSDALDVPAVSRTPSSNAEQSSGSSPGIHSQGSSPPVSPRPLGSVDDLDHFRDLFYRPDQSGASTSPSQERSGDSFTSERGGSGISWSSRGHRTASGLTSLARQLSQELEELSAQEQLANQLDEDSANPGQRLVGFRGESPLNVSTDLHFVLSEGSISQSPMVDSSPLRLENEQSNQSPSVNIPEDVESSRASSLLEPPSHHDDEDDTFGLVRVGLVEAVNTPATVHADHRASGHISLVDEDTRRRVEPPGQLRALSHTSSLQPWSADFTRSSYMTSDTGASRISGLSDFPEPPISNMTPAHMSVLASYFSSTPAEEGQAENPPDSPTESIPSEPPSAKFPLRRMTFGGDQDIENLADAGQSET